MPDRRSRPERRRAQRALAKGELPEFTSPTLLSEYAQVLGRFEPEGLLLALAQACRDFETIPPFAAAGVVRELVLLDAHGQEYADQNQIGMLLRGYMNLEDPGLDDLEPGRLAEISIGRWMAEQIVIQRQFSFDLVRSILILTADDDPIGQARIRMLAGYRDLAYENLDAEGKILGHDKDKGLDVVSGWVHLDPLDGGGQPWVLIQCACGGNWKAKSGEPSITVWNGLIAWNGPLIRAIAIPWLRPDTWSSTRVYQHFDGAMVLTRDRIIRGHPDARLDDPTATEIRTWCEPRLASLPTV